MSTPTITPTSPAMRLLLDAMDIAADSLRNDLDDAGGSCHECTVAAERSLAGDGKCITHQANVDEAGRVKALRDALRRAKDAGEVAAILAGTGVAL